MRYSCKSTRDYKRVASHHSRCVFSFKFLKKFFRDQRWPTAPLFVGNICPSFEEFTAPLRHILPIYNFVINSNNLFVNFRWTFILCVEKSYDGTHLAFGGTLDWREFGMALPFQTCLTQTKPVLPLSKEHRSQVKIKVDGSVATINIKISLLAHT